jgi:transposase, IS5 family
MLIDRYPPEDVFARVPELVDQTDPVLVHLDRLLDDDTLYRQVRADLARRSRLTPVHGRPSTPAEVLLRLLVVKHLYGWSFEETERCVTDSLVLRWFCRVYFRRVPDDTTLLRWAQTIRPATLHALTARAAQLAAPLRVTRARKLRVDATVVETTIHYPTDSGLLGDGVRVLTRLVQRAKPLLRERLSTARGARDIFRNRLRAMRRTLQALYRTVRRKGEDAVAQQRRLYEQLIQSTEQTLEQARRIRQALDRAPGESAASAQRSGRAAPPHLRAELDRFLPLVAQVIHQARTRVVAGGQVPAQEKLVSLFEPHTRILRRHKTGTPVEFGRQLVLDEVDGGIICRYRVLGPGEGERHDLPPAVAHHRDVFGHPPWLVSADRGFHVAGQDSDLQAAGVRQVAVPASGQPSGQRRALEHSRAWKRRYRWRAGIEGRIHSLRRDFGLKRCAYHGERGLERWVGWGLLASNLRQIARVQASRGGRGKQRTRLVA